MLQLLQTARDFHAKSDESRGNHGQAGGCARRWALWRQAPRGGSPPPARCRTLTATGNRRPAQQPDGMGINQDLAAWGAETSIVTLGSEVLLGDQRSPALLQVRELAASVPPSRSFRDREGTRPRRAWAGPSGMTPERVRPDRCEVQREDRDPRWLWAGRSDPPARVVGCRS